MTNFGKVGDHVKRFCSLTTRPTLVIQLNWCLWPTSDKPKQLSSHSSMDEPKLLGQIQNACVVQIWIFSRSQLLRDHEAAMTTQRIRHDFQKIRFVPRLRQKLDFQPPLLTPRFSFPGIFQGIPVHRMIGKRDLPNPIEVNLPVISQCLLF